MDTPRTRSKLRLQVRAAAVLSVVLVFASCSATPSREVPAHVRALEERNRHLEQQFQAGNLLGVADVYADDAVLVDARGQRTTGREEIDAYWSAIESPIQWRLETRSIRGSDAVAYQLGTSHLTTRRDGELHTSVTEFLLFWRKEENGEWRIELDAYWPVTRR
jgi:uncharacterized protein (TIGR02246 family)